MAADTILLDPIGPPLVPLPKSRLIVACVASLVLAIPLVTLMSALVVFPLLFYGLLAVIANFGPIAILATRALGLGAAHCKVLEAWTFCAIIWVGCAYGLSHWGDAGSTLGAKNSPYFEMLLAPYFILFKYVTG